MKYSYSYLSSPAPLLSLLPKSTQLILPRYLVLITPRFLLLKLSQTLSKFLIIKVGGNDSLLGEAKNDTLHRQDGNGGWQRFVNFTPMTPIGIQDLWHGWLKLHDLCEGWQLARNT